MVDISIISSQDVVVTTPIPTPIIIWAGMEITEWKNFFIQKSVQATTPTKKIAYDRCLKIIMWAEFCDGTLTKVGNYKDKTGIHVQFHFSFPTLAVRCHFDRNVEKNVEAITNPTNRFRATV